jgi:hypothetical protein
MEIHTIGIDSGKTPFHGTYARPASWSRTERISRAASRFFQRQSLCRHRQSALREQAGKMLGLAM